MTKEHRYSLTRVCLRRGELSLPRDLIGAFPDGTAVKAVDSRSGTEFPLTAAGDRLLRGLGEFFAEHDLEPNDTLLIRLEEDGRVKLTPQARERRPRTAAAPSARDIIRSVLDAAPVTEAEARALLPGLPPEFDLRGFLSRTGEFVSDAGRWHAAARYAGASARDGEEAAPGSPAPAAPETPEAASRTFIPEVFGTLGFGVQQLTDSRWLLESAVGGGGWRAVVQETAAGERLDWGALLEERRRQGATWLAVTGEHADLLALVAPAGLAQATLWPDHALERLLQLSLSLPLGPADLEPHFRQHGLWEAGLQRFERSVQQRIAERGAFSTVLGNLSLLQAPAEFSLEQAAAGVDQEAARLVLLQLSRSPFQLVLQRQDGRWYLRSSVRTALEQLAEYASSLLARLPHGRGAEAGLVLQRD